MKKLLVLAVACFVASPAFAADLKWYGETGARYSQGKFDDSLAAKDANGLDVSMQTTKAHAIRARLGVTGGHDHVDYGFGVKTTTAGVVNTSYVNYNQNQDLGIGIDLAYFHYSNDFGFGDLGVTVGRGNNVFAYDENGQFLFDNDVSWDGFGWKWKMGNIGFNAAQYILGGNSGLSTSAANGSSRIVKTAASDNGGTPASGVSQENHTNFETMLGFQPTFSFRFTDDIESMFAVGYYVWNGTTAPANATGNYSNALHGNQTQVAAGKVGSNTILDDTQFMPMANARIWQLLVDTSLPMGFNASFEYLRNKKNYYDEYNNSLNQATSKSIEAKRTAWSATLGYGKIAKAHDWKVSYSYGNRGLASSYNYYANDLFAADQKGHTITGSYALTDSLSLGAKYMTLKEISNLDRNGNAPGTTAGLVGGFTGTTNAASVGRSHKWKYWELTAGVAF